LGLVFVAVAGLAGCGDDDDAANAADATATSDACASLVEFNTVAAGTEDTDTSTPDGAKEFGTQLAPLWEKARDAVPASAADDAQAVTDAIDDLQNGDDAAFNADATFESYSNALTAAIGSCDFATQEVAAVEDGGDYSFEGLPSELDAGVVAITLDNDAGAEPHVMIVYRKNDGETRSAEELLALPEDEGAAAGNEVGAVFAGPGSSSVGLVSLTSGDYVYFCPIPIGGADDAPPHFAHGMYGEFTVK
jgi:hypothetical protein